MSDRQDWGQPPWSQQGQSQPPWSQQEPAQQEPPWSQQGQPWPQQEQGRQQPGYGQPPWPGQAQNGQAHYGQRSGYDPSPQQAYPPEQVYASQQYPYAPQQSYPPQQPSVGARPHVHRRRKSWVAEHAVLTGALVVGAVAVVVVGAVAYMSRGSASNSGTSGGNAGTSGENSGTSVGAAAGMPPATVLVLGSKLTLINAATHAVGRQLPVENAAGESGETGRTQMAFARTAHGFTAYVLGFSDVVPVNVATGTAGKPINVAGIVIAASPDGKTVYVASATKTGPNSYSGVVIPINTATDAVGRAIAVGARADDIVFAPDGKTAYVLGSDTVTPIDVATGTAEPYITVGAYPTAVIFAPDGKTAYVNGSEVVPIDVATGQAEAPIAVTAGALAITPDGKTLYAVTTPSADAGTGPSDPDTVTPIDTATNSPGTPISLSSQPQIYLELLMAPDGKTVYAMDQQGQLTAVDTQTNTAQPTVEDGSGYANDMAITPDGKTIYLIDPEDNLVIPYGVATRTMGKAIDLAGSNPNIEVANWVVVAP